MTITVSQKEFESISNAQDHIYGLLEGCEDEALAKDFRRIIDDLYSVMDKYKKARSKAADFQYVRAQIAQKAISRNLRPRDIDKLARQYMKKIKENTL